jgi:hypothetical protein
MNDAGKIGSFTPGPLTMRVSPRFPHDIEIVAASGEVVRSFRMPCHSSADQSVGETVSGVNLPADWQEEGAAANACAVADGRLYAAAPDLLEALKEAHGAVNDAFGQANAEYQGLDYLASKYDDKIASFRAKAKAAILKAEGR